MQNEMQQKNHSKRGGEGRLESFKQQKQGNQRINCLTLFFVIR